MRHVSRHLHATLVNYVRDGLDDAGWISAPINFGAEAVEVVDYQPDERGEEIKRNTVAISLGDVPGIEDLELGAGLRAIDYPVFIDVYMAEQPYATAICDDLRDLLQEKVMDLVDQGTGLPAADHRIEIVMLVGPERPDASIALENFKRYWRIMRVEARLEFV